MHYEHTYRFAKTQLGWDKARLRYPEQVSRWTWLILCALTQWRLAPPAEDHCQRWERRRLRGKLSPGPGPPGFWPASRACRNPCQATKTIQTRTRTAQRTRQHPRHQVPHHKDDLMAHRRLKRKRRDVLQKLSLGHGCNITRHPGDPERTPDTRIRALTFEAIRAGSRTGIEPPCRS